MAKRSDQLFHYLVDISKNLVEAAQSFSRGLKDLSEPDRLAADIKQLEAKGDELTSSLITLLNATYITPLDREDFLTLAVSMDDIVDGLEACTVRFDLYNISQATEPMFIFAENVKESVAEINLAMEKLKDKNLLDIRQHTNRLNQLEKAGDALLRQSLRTLFNEPQDPITIIKLKEIYEILENVTDKCEDVGDVLDSVIVKNA